MSLTGYFIPGEKTTANCISYGESEDQSLVQVDHSPGPDLQSSMCMSAVYAYRNARPPRRNSIGPGLRCAYEKEDP